MNRQSRMRTQQHPRCPSPFKPAAVWRREAIKGGMDARQQQRPSPRHDAPRPPAPPAPPAAGCSRRQRPAVAQECPLRVRRQPAPGAWGIWGCCSTHAPHRRTGCRRRLDAVLARLLQLCMVCTVEEFVSYRPPP